VYNFALLFSTSYTTWASVDVTLLPVTASCVFGLFAHGFDRVSYVFDIHEC